MIRFEKIIPRNAALRSYIKYFAISEQTEESTYKVFPSMGMVMGFQYHGKLAHIQQNTTTNLATAGVTGIADSFRIFRNTPHTQTILVYFTEIGWAHFTDCPAHELFDQSIALNNIFEKQTIAEIEEKLFWADMDAGRIRVLEDFFLSQFIEFQDDKLIIEAIRLIYKSKGSIRIKELNQELCTSPSPLEKRFKKLVGTTPKKFASLVRFNAILKHFNSFSSFTELCYEHHFFDQAHFIKDFKQYTGETPENFKSLF